ncbi:MAG: TRAP transporter small permease [Deltaproteobacteria bacterium]|nr:TRAP transporter small permease [Deltaproteobacteria bacterium]
MLHSGWVKFSRVVNGISELFGSISGLLIMFMAVSTTYDVCLRYFFNKPSIWVVEVSEFMLAATACLGACYTLKQRRHVAVDLLIDRIPPKPRRYLGIGTSFISFLTCVVLSILSFDLWYEAFTTGERTWTTLRAPLGFLYLYFFIGMLVLTFQYVVNIGDDISNLKDHRE